MMDMIEKKLFSESGILWFIMVYHGLSWFIHGLSHIFGPVAHSFSTGPFFFSSPQDYERFAAHDNGEFSDLCKRLGKKRQRKFGGFYW